LPKAWVEEQNFVALIRAQKSKEIWYPVNHNSRAVPKYGTYTFHQNVPKYGTYTVYHNNSAVPKYSTGILYYTKTLLFPLP
jgi:hypothetical protein